MNCPEYGTCHDPERCQQGGSCEDAVAKEPWPATLICAVVTCGLSMLIGIVGVLSTWSLAPLWVTVVGLVISFAFACSAIPWSAAWRERHERRRDNAARAEIIEELERER